MAGLLYKELIINKKSLLIYLGTVLFLSFGMIVNITGDDIDPEKVAGIIPLFYFMIFFFTGMFQPNLFEPDETKKWAYFATSTPAMARGQVYSKYMAGFLMSLFAMLWCQVLDMTVNFILGTQTMAMSAVYIFFYAQLFLRAVEYPFIVRFGSKIGSTYKMASFFLVIFIVFVYLLFGDLSMLDMNNIFDIIYGILDGSIFSDNVLFVISLSPYLAIASYYLSYRMSCKFYLKGAESFER
ncbi:MAG: ABC-2 transporter permease [Oscillospiraceae bacterium]|nr:ABC-2 transporter permease [Oscillospiraceae bacterium]